MAYDIAPRAPGKLSYEDAVLYCFFLNHNGLTGWRLPTSADIKRANISRKVWTAEDARYANSTVRKMVQPFRVTGRHLIEHEVRHEA